MDGLLNENNKNNLKNDEYFKELTDTNSWSIQLNLTDKKQITGNINIIMGVNKPETIKELKEYKKKLQKIIFSNKNVYSIQHCENLCYTSKTKKLLINKSKCANKIKEYTQKYMSNNKL